MIKKSSFPKYSTIAISILTMILAGCHNGNTSTTQNNSGVLQTVKSVASNLSVVSPPASVWENGSKSGTIAPVYGTQGVPSTSNTPGSLQDAMTWVDSSGNLWLFGGFCNGSPPNQTLWKYNHKEGTWTWVAGAKAISLFPTSEEIKAESGKYGVQGVASTNNFPGARDGSITWVDKSGNFWLFGGSGQASESSTSPYDQGILNDLWKFNPKDLTWTWVAGSSNAGQIGNYGTKNIEASTNVPGARWHSSGGIDSDGNLWIFGGNGLSSVTQTNLDDRMRMLGDLWKFNISTGKWTWISGSNLGGSIGNFGTKGVESATNEPINRIQNVMVIDSSNNIWIFGGGETYNGHGNDLWKYNQKTKMWTFMSGSSYGASGATAIGTKGVASVNNQPAGRDGANGWIDKSNNIWIFGGSAESSNGISSGSINDLWKYNINDNTWTWVSGSLSLVNTGTYGTKGVSNINNIPSARAFAAGTVDASGSYWIYGGDSLGGYTADIYSDLWIIGTGSLPTPVVTPTPNPTEQPPVAPANDPDFPECLPTDKICVSNMTNYPWERDALTSITASLYFGLRGMVITNQSSSNLVNFQLNEPFPSPYLSIDYSRSSCFSNKSADTPISLSVGNSCNIVLRYQPIYSGKLENNTFEFYVAGKLQSNSSWVYSQKIYQPYSSQM